MPHSHPEGAALDAVLIAVTKYLAKLSQERKVDFESHSKCALQHGGEDMVAGV